MNHTHTTVKTLRLLMPQWQGGYDESEFPGWIYPLGARLLAWLAPESAAPLVEVPIEPWTNGTAMKEGGVFYRRELLRQVRAARSIIDAHAPDRVITFGGDCLISQAPFAYLNERCEGDIGIIWIDAHPDVTTPRDFDHAHAMVLGNLLGEGEPLLAGEVKKRYAPEQVLLAGVGNVLPHERETITRLGIRTAPGRELAENADAVTGWIREKGFRRVAVHLDLDVLDPVLFRSLLFSNPGVENPIEAERGTLRMRDVASLLRAIAGQADVVGMSFAEYMPWDALNLQKMLGGLPFMH